MTSQAISRAELCAIKCRMRCQVAIMPGVKVGHGDNGPGCFTPTHEPAVTNGQLFGWEVRSSTTCWTVSWTPARHSASSHGMAQTASAPLIESKLRLSAAQVRQSIVRMCCGTDVHDVHAGVGGLRNRGQQAWARRRRSPGDWLHPLRQRIRG